MPSILIPLIALALAAPAERTSPGGQPQAARKPELVQYQDRGRLGTRERLFDAPTIRAPRSLFRPYVFQFGPHYQPPPVAYEPPSVTYDPPLERRQDRCSPRTRAWYASCAARYRSFDPNTGTYKTYSGQARLCRCP